MEQWASEAAMNELASAYGLRIRAVLPLRSVVGLITDTGKWMCKRYAPTQGMDRERLIAVAAVKEQLAKSGVGPAYLHTLAGESIWSYEGDPVTVEPWLAGRHADFSVLSERIAAIQAVARLHAARVQSPYVLQHPPTLLQKLAYRLERADEAVQAGRLVGLTEAEWQKWRKYALETLHQLPIRDIADVTNVDRRRGIYCHRDLAPHNVLICSGAPARLIDFDLSGVETPVYDLHQLFGHIAYAAPGLPDVQGPMLDAYARLAPLTQRHQHVLRALDAFPALLLRELGEAKNARGKRGLRRAAARILYAREVEERRLADLARHRRFVVC
ncbi:MAG: phosphotransferase [Firmicutes bacterium]|nr:phosphotransferase [Bacillota bacterium]